MAIFRCKKCGYLRELPNQHVGKKAKCPVCQQVVPIYDTLFFVKSILKQHFSMQTELRKVKADTDESVVNETFDMDVFNTTAMMEEQQYKPILDWFNSKKIQLNIDKKSLDTTGFFDEVAVKLGDNYNTLRIVTDKIKRIQNKGYDHVKIDLSHYSEEERHLIKEFCEELYEYAFVARTFIDKKHNTIHLNLQMAKSIVNFFNGVWLEWFAFMKLLALCHKNNISFSGLRSFNINFANNDKNELDIFFLINNNIPIFVECKSGEFRPFIDKYIKLRKKLKIDKSNFIMLIADLSEEQSQALTMMFDITFVNEKNFIKYISTLLSDVTHNALGQP